MNKLDEREQATYQRVDQFGKAHGADFAAGSPAANAFAYIATLVPKAVTDAGTQAAGKGEAKSGTASRKSVRIALHNELKFISETADGIALVTPGFNEKFRMPKSGSDQALLTSAVAFIADATPVKATFVAHEMPADFLDVTLALIDQFKATGVDQNDGLSKQVGGTAALKEDRHKGMLMLELLRSIVPNKYRNNPAVMAQWLTASHVERPTHHKKPAPPTPPH
jgi:hypothetical protein